MAHSLSPVIHNAGYAAAGLTGWSYEAIECAEAALPDLVAGLGPRWAGLSLTMPLKEVALRVADEVTPLAATLGAANTLVRISTGGGWRAENTDAPGIMAAVGATTPVEELVVLGAGGTARAALGAAAELTDQPVTVVARRPQALAELEPVAAKLGLRLRPRPWSQAPAAVAVADLVIATLPAGAADPLADQLRWRPGAVLLDVLYHPWPTRLAAAAVAAGIRVVPGSELLLAQAVGQFELFTGVAAPVDAMRVALTAAVDSR